MVSMFQGATSFNSSVNGWTLTNLVTTNSMFKSATGFNLAIENWNAPSLTNISSMFEAATTLIKTFYRVTYQEFPT